jgi:hypothetical protein
MAIVLQRIEMQNSVEELLLLLTRTKARARRQIFFLHGMMPSSLRSLVPKAA